MDPYHLKYLKYKNKYVTYKNKYFKIQKGGKNTLEQDIATYTILSVDDELSKLILTQLIIIRNSNDISKLLELKNEIEDVVVLEHYNEKMSELVTQPSVVHRVVNGPAEEPSYTPTPSYTPERNITDISIPVRMQTTQSQFYMPPIAEAYRIARGQKVPQAILNASGIILKLINKTTQQKLINEDQYNLMVVSIVKYLKIPGKLDILTKQFVADTCPSTEKSGHIDAKNQEELLGAVTVPVLDKTLFGGDVTAQILLEYAISTHYV
jgi:hypothetical protein